jgi:DNA-directed RNA polymerase subunit beta'
LVYGKDGELIRSYNLPAHLMVENGEKIKAGKVLVKIPRRSSKSGDIGGLPRITELLEARNPSNQLVSEIDGVVSFGKMR